jgi:hypothetical protein
MGNHGLNVSSSLKYFCWQVNPNATGRSEVGPNGRVLGHEVSIPVNGLILLYKHFAEPGMVEHTINPAIWKVEASGL